jgi:hypothetical protein
MAGLQSTSMELSQIGRQAEIAEASGVLRIEVSGDIGYLYFLEGALVHASTLELAGEEAVLAMLGWDSPTPAWCERRWPRERNVHRSFSQLLSEPASASAAQASRAEPEPEPEAAAAEHALASPPSSAHFPSSFGLRQALGRASLGNVLRLKDGVATNTRGASDHLRPIAQSTLTLADWFGASLGVGPLIAAEASTHNLHRLLARSSEENIVVEASTSHALRVVRAFLKLS